MSTRTGLVRTGSLLLAGSVVGALANFALAAVLGRGLGAAPIGTFFAVVAAFAIATNVFELGADTGLVRGLARHRALGRVRDVPVTVMVAIGPVLVVGVVAAVLVWWGADVLAGYLGGPADRATRAAAYRDLAPLIPVASLLAVVLGGLRGLGETVGVMAVQNLGLPLLRLAVAAAAVGAGLGVRSVLQVWGAALVVALVVAGWRFGWVLRRTLREGGSDRPGGPSTGRRRLARDFWAFSAPRSVAAAVEIVLEWLDVLVLAIVVSPREAGIYAVVTRCVRAGQIVEHAIRVTVAPRISALAATSSTADQAALFTLTSRALVTVAVPAYVSLAVLAPQVLGLFGAGFDEGAVALRIASAGMALAVSAGALQSLILMAGRSHWQLGNKVAALVVAGVLLAVLVPRFGMAGAAVAWMAAVLTDTVRAGRQVRRLGVRAGDGVTLRLALLGLVVFGVAGVVGTTVLSGALSLVAVLAVALAGYSAALWRYRRTLLSLPAGAAPVGIG